MSRNVSEIFEKARKDLDREKRRLESLKQDAEKAPAVFDHEGFDAMSRALSFVVMGGVLEDLMREIPAALASDVTALQLERRHLPISFMAAIEAAAFRQCHGDNVNAIAARAGVVKSVIAHQSDLRPVPDFTESLTLADGTTVGEKHFVALWLLLGLSGDWKNDANDRLLLREIKEKRNDVAHWKEDPVEIGRQKRPSDLLAMVDRLISLLDHLALHIFYWLDARTANVAAASQGAGP
jgi:hypothetical protein